MKCVNCGKESLDNKDVVIYVNDKGEPLVFCRDCAAQFGTCVMCQHNIPCGFFNDPDPTPQFKIVMQQMRQGNATYIEQRQVPNVDRIKKFCTDGKCRCFLDDPEHPLCCRHGGCTTCTNYCEKEQFNFVQDFSMTKASEN